MQIFGQKWLTGVKKCVIIMVLIKKGGKSQVFLSGRSSHQLDDKGRIRIPAKFKDALGEHPFITVGRNNCLYIYPQAEAERIMADRFGDVDGFDDDPKLDKMRKIFSRGEDLEEDKQGRITIPSYLLDHAKVKKNIISIGMRNRIELWAEDVWNEYDSSIDLDSSFKSSEKVN